MDHERFRDGFSRFDELTAAQRKEGAAALAAIELGVDDERRRPHCGAGGAVKGGRARGLRRFRCKGAGGRSVRSPARHCPDCTTRSTGLPSLPRLPKARRSRSLRRAAGLRRARRIAGATAFWRRRSTSLTSASTPRPASGSGAPCTSGRSTAATAGSRASCAASAASPPSTSTAISGGSISSNSATRHRPEPASRRRWRSHACGLQIEPRQMVE